MGLACGPRMRCSSLAAGSRETSSTRGPGSVTVSSKRASPRPVAATLRTSVARAYGSGGGGRAEFIPLMVEIFRDVKNIFVDNPIEAFTKGTGGTEYTFFKQHGLEESIQKIGSELHSQYFVSYTPNNKDEGGFHTLSVTVGPYKTQTRPGYWLGTKQ